MSLERARNHLDRFGKVADIMEFDVSSATVELASQAIGCDSAHIAKTLSFVIGDRIALVICAGDMKVSNPKFKAVFHTKPKMLSADEAESRIGHAVGGVCPFGVNEGCDVYLDESLKRFECVYPACGSSNSAIKLSIEELEEVTPGSTWIDVCKPIECDHR